MHSAIGAMTDGRGCVQMKFLRLEQNRNGKPQKLFINIEHISYIEPNFGCPDSYSDIHLFNGAWIPGVIGNSEELIKTVENYFDEMEKKH